MNGLYLEDSHFIEPMDEEDKQDGEEDMSAGIDALHFNTSKYMYGTRLRSLWGPGYTDLIVARSVSYGHWEIYEKGDQDSAGSLRHITSYRRTDITDQVHLHWTGRGFGGDEWSAGASLKPITYRHELWVAGDSIVFNDDYLGPDSLDLPDTFYFDDIDEDVDETALKYAGYLQYTWRPKRTLSVTGGLRHDGFDYSGYDVVGPRLSMNWEFRPRWTFSLAWGIYYQSQNSAVYMDDTAQGANRHLPYSRADQYIAGITYLPRLSSLVSLEGYYKDYGNLLVGEEDIIHESTGDHTFTSDVLLAERTKEAWGLEFFAQQKLTGNWYGTFSYSYGKAESTDPAYDTYSASYDFRHATTVVFGYRTSLITKAGYRNLIRKPWFIWMYLLPINGDELTLSTRYRYMTGRPLTPQLWYTEGQDSPEPIYEGHWESEGFNNGRYPEYSRWDIRLDNRHYFGGSALVFYFEMQNVLDHQNVAQYFYSDNGEVETIHQFRRIFLGGIRYEF